MAQLDLSILAAVDIAFAQLASAGTYTPATTGYPAQVLARVDVITRQPGGGMASVTAHIYLRVSDVAEPAEGDTFLDALGNLWTIRNNHDLPAEGTGYTWTVYATRGERKIFK